MSGPTFLGQSGTLRLYLTPNLVFLEGHPVLDPFTTTPRLREPQCSSAILCLTQKLDIAFSPVSFYLDHFPHVTKVFVKTLMTA